MTTAVAEQQPQTMKSVKDLVLSYIPLGEVEPLPLSFALVQKYICKPTAKGVMPSPRDIVGFMFLCRARKLNPFTGDVYLIGYDEQGGGATFVMTCGVDHFMKRAELHESYDGFESGVSVICSKDAEGKTLPQPVYSERAGEIVLPHERLVGAWCKVYRSDRTRPTYRSVNLDSYDKGRSLWKSNKAGMLCKVAESAGHRKAFPLSLGGMYSAEETAIEAVDVGSVADAHSDELSKMQQAQLQAPREDVAAIAEKEPEVQLHQPEEAPPAAESEPAKKKRGRPRKTKKVEPAQEQPSAPAAEEPPPGEGMLFDEEQVSDEHIALIKCCESEAKLTELFQMLFSQYGKAGREQLTDLCREKGKEFE